MTVPARFAATMKDRLRGLLGRERAPGVIVLAPCRSIHTFGMRYPIDVAFISAQGEVMRALRDVEPGKVRRCRGAYAVVERAADPQSRWLAPGDALGVCLIRKERKHPHQEREERP